MPHVPAHWRMSLAASLERLSSAPVMGLGHPHAGAQRPHLGDYGVGSSVPARDFARYQHHLAAQLSPVPLVDVGPQE